MLPFGSRELVQLGGDDMARHAAIHQPGPGAAIGLQVRVPAVHEQQRGAAPRSEVRGGQPIEAGPRDVPATG
jgi:hypothetical protein